MLINYGRTKSGTGDKNNTLPMSYTHYEHTSVVTGTSYYGQPIPAASMLDNTTLRTNNHVLDGYTVTLLWMVIGY